MMSTVYLGIGSNIDAEANLKKTAELLKVHWPDIQFSSVFRTKARDVEDQADFLNAVAVLDTSSSMEEIMVTLREIERTLGKAPPFRFGPRTIDLDLLLYGDEVLENPNLIVPHPRMHERLFVLKPLSELIDLEQKHPTLNQTWAELLESVLDQECEPTGISL